MLDDASPPRVVITGLGVVTSLGISIEEFWQNLLAGRNGISRVTRFDPSDFSCQVGAEIRDFDPTEYMDAKEVRRNDRYTHYGVAASKIAVEDANLDLNRVNKDGFGVFIGSGIGGMETIEYQARRLFEMGPRRVSPFMIPSLIANIASGVVAIEVGARGPNFSIVSACSSATHAIGEAYRELQEGDSEIMLAGGSEAAITQIGYAGFCSMRAMSTRFNDSPEKASRPFDRMRDGFIMGEGSGVVVLETLAHARQRKARIYCEIIGYAATCDAYHVTTPDPNGNGLKLCLQRALKKAKMKPEDVDYINAHGTSTPYNDRTETNAVKEVFGKHAYKVPMSSTKSMTGHLLGAAGGIEVAATAKVIETGMIPPTINYEVSDPECDLNYVPNQKRNAEVNVAMSNNMGFGGHNASIVLKACR